MATRVGDAFRSLPAAAQEHIANFTIECCEIFTSPIFSNI